MRWQNKKNGYTMVFLLIAIIFILGGYLVFKNLVQTKRYPLEQQSNISGNSTSATREQKYFSCLQSDANNKIDSSNPYKNGAIVFKAKDGTSEDTILSKLRPLGFNLKTVNSAWGYSGIDRSTIFIRHSMAPDEAQNTLITIANGFEIVRGFPTGFYYKSADIYFTKMLSKEQQQSINAQLDKLKTQGKITEYTWNYAPKQLYGFLAVPMGRENEFIEKLYTLGIFDCVSKELTTIPYMPGPVK